MTVITAYRRERYVTGFAVEGHSGYAAAGRDVLCAAVSAAVQLVECQLTDILAVPLDIQVDEKRARISLKLKRGIDPEPAQPPFCAFLRVAAQWVREYPDYIKIQEDFIPC